MDPTTTTLASPLFSRQWYSLLLLPLLVLLLLLIEAGAAHGEQTTALQAVSLQLKWHHQYQFAGYYAALHQGFYRDQGLDVQLLEGGPQIKVDEQVLSGHADFGVLASELIQKKAEGEPMVLLAALFQHSTRVLLIRAELGVESPADLIGKSLMINLNEDIEFQAMFLAEGVDYRQLSLQPKDQSAISRFSTGEIDGFNGSIGNQTYLLQRRKLAYTTIRPINYGIDFYGDSLFTSARLLKKQPEVVDKFRSASLRGWQYAMDHQEEMIALIREHYAPEKSLEQLRFEAQAIERLIMADIVEIGHINPYRVERIAEIYAKQGLIPADYALSGFIYTPTKERGDLKRIIILLVFGLSGLVLCTLIFLFFNARLKRLVTARTLELDRANSELRGEMEKRRQREMEIKAKHSLLETVIEGTDDPVYVKNLKGEYLLVNSAFEEALGQRKEAIIGRDDQNLFPPEELQTIKENDARVIDSKTSYTSEEKLTTSQGETCWLTSKHPYRDAAGRVIGVIGISRDITQLKLIEREKKLLQERLNQAQKMEAIGTLAGGIARDFNNILGAILGYAELAWEDSPSDSTIREELGEVITASHRAKELVQQILAFSRQAESKRISCQPATIIKESLKLLRSSLPTTISVHQDIDPGCGSILADPTQIHQIIINLATNAFHAMESQGGTLSLALRQRYYSLDDLSQLAEAGTAPPGHYLELRCSDTGLGIPPQVMAKIFEPYFTTKETGKGTGMGLAIVHGIVQSYGGVISCKSREGEGSTFTVLLPVFSEKGTPALKEEDLPLTGSEHILLVDDETMLVDLGRIMLKRLGYRVTGVSSSTEALRIFQEQPHAIDLVITDQTMPGMTGLDLAREMLRLRPGVPIILATGYSSIVAEKDVRALGIKGFVMKPLLKKEIASLIRTLLREKPTTTPGE
ncbi:ABC transporter substrate-binding protein [Desulfogranum mediterraneum]|uniref:ABC transporter substrate-binding protein n=1 Tax=Desulfogranum mediterraneum TaxID=160661 RepID=UPI0004234D21|nr:ABC transporter substrate-binding protein [Desulfogranum mediterraneum]